MSFKPRRKELSIHFIVNIETEISERKFILQTLSFRLYGPGKKNRDATKNSGTELDSGGLGEALGIMVMSLLKLAQAGPSLTNLRMLIIVSLRPGNDHSYNGGGSVDLMDLVGEFDLVDPFRLLDGRKRESTWQGRVWTGFASLGG